jgi:hypothetical protein
MDGEGVLFFLQLITPFMGVIFLVVGLIALDSWRKRGVSKAVRICLCIMALIVIGWLALLFLIRHDNLSCLHGLEEYEDYVDTGTLLYWDDYADTFRYDGDKYVRIFYREDYPNWFEDIEEVGTDEVDEPSWYQDHAVLNLRDRQSFGERLTAYEDRTTVFSIESGSGETILVSESHGYHCKEKAIDKVLQYYSDFNNYDFYANGKKVKAPSQKTIDTLNQLMNHKEQKLAENPNGKRYLLNIKSKDSLYENAIEIMMIDESYYLVGAELNESTDDLVDTGCKIPKQAAEELKRYLDDYPDE